jgi:hypothetical protein
MHGKPVGLWLILKTVQIFICTIPTTIYFDRLETVSFFCLFTREGDMEYTGGGNTEQGGLKARVLPCFAILPRLA